MGNDFDCHLWKGAKEVMQKYRTTEKDMEFARQFPLMKKAGFVEVRQYLRLSELPLVPINQDAAVDQKALFSGLTINTTDV